MAYTINANAKNVWIRDNEDTRDLSIQTDASSVYLDNGRTLEHELGEGSMVSNVVTVDSAMSKVTEGTYDGAYESCVFKGKSLVNLVRNTGTNLFSTSGQGKVNKTETSHGMIYETSREDLNTYITIRTGANSMMKPNTSYTIFFEIVQNTIVKNGQSYKGVTVCGVNDSYFGRGTNQLYHNPNFSLDKGIKKIMVTTDSDISSYDGFGFGFPSFSSGEVTQGQTFEIQNVMVVEGDHVNQDIPYFEGLCDVKMPILRNVGKNLFDGELIRGNISGGSGEDINNAGFESKMCRTNYIKVTPGSNFTASIEGKYVIEKISQVDKDKKFIATTEKNIPSVSIKLSNNTSFIRCVIKSSDSSEITLDDVRNSNIQFEESPTKTSYEPHKSNILRTSEEIVLREVGGVCDTYNPLTGEYTKRIGEKVLCGETVEDWRDFRNTFIEKTETIDVYLINPEQKSNSNLLCDKMRTTSKGAYMNDEEGISCSGGSGLNVWVSISKNKLSTPNKEGFKQWLQSNPLTVQYELAEPVTTIVKPSSMTPFAYQNGHVILESGYEGQSLLPTLEYSTVVNRIGQVESVAKVIQKQEKQLTMLEQMLIQNIIGLDYNNTVLALNLEINEVM